MAVSIGMLAFPLAAYWVLSGAWYGQRADAEISIEHVAVPGRRVLKLPADQRHGDLVLYRFQAPVSQSMVYDIEATEWGAWLGTGHGLIRFEPDHSAIGYRAFDDAPGEWVRRLALRNDVIAVDIMVADGPTGGQDAGAHLFDADTESWHPLGDNVADQVWLDGDLWQRTLARSLIRWTRDGKGWVSQAVTLDTHQCSEASLAAIDDALWIAQQGTARGGLNFARTARAIPCGLLRYDPASGSETGYSEQNGMPSGFARDVGGDANQVYVSHSIKHHRISQLDLATGEWRSMQAVGTGNRMAVSEAAVWLATPSAKHPLVRIDRLSHRRTDVSGIPEGYFVSAIDVIGESVWFGLHRKHWQGQTYTVESMLGRLED